ncbi:MAG: RNA-binding domain-containing protein [Candidatus Xenobiia bacterium LiM19]
MKKWLLSHLLHGTALAIMIVVITILTLLGFVSLITKTYRTSEDLYLSLVRYESSAIERRSELFFKPVVSNLSIVRDWGQEGIIRLSDEKSLNLFFIPILTQHQTIASVMLVNTAGEEYYLQRDGENWMSYMIKKGIKREKVTVNIWNRDKKPVKKTVKNMAGESYDPRTAEWYRDQAENKEEGNICWTEPYMGHILKKPVITGSMGWAVDDSSERFILAFNYILLDVIASVTSTKTFNDRKVFLVGIGNELIDLTPDKEVLDAYTTSSNPIPLLGHSKDPVINGVFRHWETMNKPAFLPLKFQNGADVWWYEFRPLPGGKRPAWIGAVIKESTLLVDVRKQSRMLIVLSFIVLIGGSIITIFLIKRYRAEIKALKTQKKFNPDSEHEVQELIRKGENSEVEFKSSMRWDCKEGKVNPRLEEVILKSIAAFSNGEGGYLIIGVNDEGQILGLEPDLSTLKENDRDHFELHLRTMLNNAYGLEYSTNFIKVHFPRINDTHICIVCIRKGERPLFTSVTDRSGQKVEKFYVRSGNSSREFARMAEAMDFIATRFAALKKA